MRRLLEGRILPPLLVYVAIRLVDALFIVLASDHKVPTPVSTPDYHVGVPSSSHSYWDVVSSWDGQWYADIATNGYPTTTPDADGPPTQSSIAFYPLFPSIVRVLMAVTRLPFDVVAPSLSLLVGAVAMILVFRLVDDCTNRSGALTVVILLNAFPSAPVFQAAYTESLALLLIAGSLILLRRQRYGWFALSAGLLGLTRNVALVLVAVVAVHWGAREIGARLSPGRPTPPRGRLAGALAGALAAVVLWPVLVAVLTGRADAYPQAIRAWPGYSGSVLRPPWLVGLAEHGPTGVVLGLLGALLFAALLMQPRVRAWGPELWAWASAYPAYILLTTGVATSILRYLLLAFPLALLLAPGAQRHAGGRGWGRWLPVVALATVMLAAQWLWISKVLVYAGPTEGWGFP